MDQYSDTALRRRLIILQLRINPGEGRPIYLQIIEQVKYQIAAETLRPDDELPSVRALASAYLINPNTVARAYLELEREEFIYKKRGMGTYVAKREVKMTNEDKLAILQELMDKALVQGVELGLDAAQMRQVFEESLSSFRKSDA